MRDMADEIEPVSRYTIARFVWMIVATLIALVIGFAGLLMWLPNAMAFANAMGGPDPEPLAQGVFLFLSAGPVVAGASLIVGWASFIFFRAPRLGARLAGFPPVLWAVLVLAYFAVIVSFCDGEFLCGA